MRRSLWQDSLLKIQKNLSQAYQASRHTLKTIGSAAFVAAVINVGNVFIVLIFPLELLIYYILVETRYRNSAREGEKRASKADQS